MGQSAMTIRLDNKLKSQFDALCAEFGMSANAAVNIFINAVVRTRSIPFSISSPMDASRERALRMIEEIRQEASQREELSLDEINAEIRSARLERRTCKDA
ncbi:MAG: type II toxin-antitoxin system RelB/DinJ family antitoxin [Bacteroidaceae bacterium]|nr:type II toxin-antitoxin system RelB/DinJ family antitoxin [Bacteroidaceae bacterium]